MSNTRSKKKKKGNTPVNKNKIKLFPPSRIAEIVFYSFVMFVLGVLTGRGTAPVSFDFDKSYQNLSQLEVPAEFKPVKVKVDFYQELDSDREIQVNKTIIKEEEKFPLKIPLYKGEKKHVELSSELLSEKAVPDKSEKKEKSENLAPVQEKKPEASAGKGLFTVQIAAMKNKEDADLLAQKILQKGFPSYSVSGVSEDSVLWHRVRVGKFNDRKTAENMRHKLLEELKISGIVLTIK